ncbi:MAG: hypothetical protein CVT92_07245 [Bacteroidetes bacterium HGW-Bacteroidetes-1]|jgi:phosphate:Na+ symporter|nr:MAG: hypothetical protein CVT92_07245 [Bacteroidetes bacterium HGW-Bacteroidetes-1]
MIAFNYIYIGLTILGSLGLFLFGMKLLSESLQKIVGVRMRQSLSSITAKPWKSMFIGLAITSLMQSSSASTVMLISFVNAGLITVLDSIGLIIGANIGTTITTWLITFFGFTFNVRSLALPLIALSIPLYFSSSSKHKSLAEFAMGFAVLFIGLQFLRDSLPNIDPESPIIEFMKGKGSDGLFPLLLIGLIGIGITMIIQSSTATITLTLVLLGEGYINFEVAAALVIGENIGTTATANIAAVIANRKAKRTALSHFLFNIFGALMLIPFFKLSVHGVENFAQWLIQNKDNNLHIQAPLSISLFHSLFNIINGLILINFTKQMEKVTQWFYPLKMDEDSKNTLLYKDNFVTPVSELSIVQASKELLIMCSIVEKMFHLIPKILLEKDEQRFQALASEMQYKEVEMDRLESDINNYLSSIAENNLSTEGSKSVNAMMIIVNNMESMADICYKMMRIIENKNKQKAWFHQVQRDGLNEMFSLVNTSLVLMKKHLEATHILKPEDAEQNEDNLNLLRIKLIEQHLIDQKNNKYPVVSGNFYQQMVVYHEKLGDHAINVIEAIEKSRTKKIKK